MEFTDIYTIVLTIIFAYFFFQVNGLKKLHQQCIDEYLQTKTDHIKRFLEMESHYQDLIKESEKTNEELQVMIKSESEKTKKANFISIKEIQPELNSHIFIWDKHEQIAIPRIYKGNKEDWLKRKDEEKRYTHFIHLEIPE